MIIHGNTPSQQIVKYYIILHLTFIAKSSYYA